MNHEKTEKRNLQGKSVSINSATEKASFEISPPPIPAKDIKETINTDVIVMGAGVAGLAAALSTAEAGAKTIQLEKGPGYSFCGTHNAAVDSRMQKQAGIKIDKDQIIFTMMEFSAYRANQQIVKLWVDNSGPVMDWLLDLSEAAK